MKKEFIVERQGRSFVLYAGLLDMAHQQGLKSIRTELVQVPNETNRHVAICTATVTLEKDGEERVFTGIGDAAPNNVAPAMQTCLIRMSETRAKARALRDAVNVGVAAFEELGEDDAHDGAPERGYEVWGSRGRAERYTPPVRTTAPVRTHTASKPSAKGDADETTPLPTEWKAPMSNPITEAQTKAIRSLCRPRSLDADVLARDKFEATDLAALTEAQASELIRSLNERTNGRVASVAA